MSTRTSPVTDPYAAYGGAVARGQQADPYASYGGSVAKASSQSAAAPADTYSGPAFEQAVQARMKQFGEPQAVAERHVRGELPENVLHPPQKEAPLPHVTPKPGDTFAQTMHRAVEMGKHVTPEEIERARKGAIERVPVVLGATAGPLVAEITPEMEGAGLVPKLVNAGSRILTQGLFGAGTDVAGHLMGGEKPNLKSAAKTGAAFAAGQAVLGELPAALLPEAKTAASAVEGEAMKPAEAVAAADPYAKYGGSAAEPTSSGLFASDEEVAAQRLARRASEGDEWAAQELQRRAAAGDPYAAKLVSPAAPPAPAQAPEPAETQPVASETAQPSVIPRETGERMLRNVESLRQIADPEKVQSAADVDRILNDPALEQNPELRAGKVVPFEQQRELAHNLGMTPDEMLSLKGTQALNAEQLLAARALTTASRDDVMNLARLAAAGDEGYEQQFLEALARHQEIADSLRARLSEAGRALGALRNEPEQRTVGDALAALEKLDGKARLTAARDLTKLDPHNPAAVEKFIRGITPRSTWDKINEYWINAILSGGTSAKKAAADTAMRVLGVAERPTAAAIDAMRSLVTGTPRTRYFGETGADLYGTFKAMPRALSQFWSTFAHDHGFDEVLDPLSGGRAYVPSIKGSLGTVVRTPTRLLESITDAAQVVNYSSEVYTQAYRQAASEGLHGSALVDRAGEIASDAFSDPDSDIAASAYDYAKRRTFTQELGKTGKAISSLTHRPGIRYVVPFARIPINIVKAGVEYSPLGLMRSQTPETAARAVLGTALAAAFLKHALNGEITGSGVGLAESDRLRMEARGWQPDSIRIGNRFYSYRYLEPIAPVLGMAADLARAIRDQKSGEIQGIGKQMSKAAASQLENLPFLSSLLFLNHALENPEKYAGSFGASFIPTALADVARMQDRNIRAPKTVKQQFESRVPGMTKNVPALRTPPLAPGVRNVYHVQGAPLLRPLSAAGGFNPFTVTSAAPTLGRTAQQIGRERRRNEQRKQRRANR